MMVFLRIWAFSQPDIFRLRERIFPNTISPGLTPTFQSIVTLAQSDLMLEMRKALRVCCDFHLCRDLGCFSSSIPRGERALAKASGSGQGCQGSGWVMAPPQQKVAAYG